MATARQIISLHGFQYDPAHHSDPRRSQNDQQELESDDAYGYAKKCQGIRHEVTRQDQERRHRQDSLENSRCVPDRNISPDDLVNGKSLERDGPCDDDIRQEANNLFEEIIRDSAFEADEICREQRESENNKIDQTLADFTENETYDRIHLSVPINNNFSWGWTHTS
jgi:hypothetical protein